MHRSFSSVVVHDGFAVIPDFSGLIHCLDAETGEPYWAYDMYAHVWATPLIVDGKIYIGDEDGEVAVFALSKEFQLLAENTLPSSQYTTIMSVDSTLYVPSVGTLFAIEDPNKQPAPKQQAQRDWPSGRGNPQNTGVAQGSLPSNLRMLWKIKTKNECEATPAVVDGVAYVGDLEDSLYAIDVATGRQRWVFRNESGFRASPLLLDGKLYVADMDGHMHCFDAEAGRQVWQFDSGTSVSCSANAVDGLVVFASEDGTVFGLDPKTGKLIWKTSAGTQLQCAPAILGKRVVIAGCDQQLYVLDRDTGERLLTTDIEAPTGATPALRDGLAYFGTADGVLFCVEIETGKIRWRYKARELGDVGRNAAAVTENLVIIAGRGRHIVAVDIETGELAWRYHAKGSFDSSPVVIDDHVLIGSTDGRLYVLDKTTGAVNLIRETGRALTSSVAVADGKLVLTTADGLIYCFGDPTQPAAKTTPFDVVTDVHTGRETRRAFRIESLGTEQLQVEHTKQGGEEQFLIGGRCRLTFGEGKDAVVTECDHATIRGSIVEAADWKGLEIRAHGNVVLRVGESELRAETIRYQPANGQFELHGVTLQLPNTDDSIRAAGASASVSQGAHLQTITGLGGSGLAIVEDPRHENREQVQILFAGPKGTRVSWRKDDAHKNKIELVAPARYNFRTGQAYHVELRNIPGREGVELYPSLQIATVKAQTRAYVAHNAISLQLTDEDIDQALAGHLVTKVIYLPDPEHQELAIAGIATVVSTRLDPGIDPVVEADRRGEIVAVLQVGNRDSDPPGVAPRDE